MMDIFAEPSATNIAWHWVSAVLPPDGSSPWGRTLQVFTSVLGFLASLGLAYSVISGIVQSAYTGKVLGDRWHQIWSPLRIIVGIGLLVPLPTTGFSSVHYILRDVVARGGINVADATWNTFVGVIAGKDGMPIVPVSETGSTVAMAILRHEVCAAVYNQGGSMWGWEQRLPDPAGLNADGVTVWNYGATCGRLAYTFPEGRANFSNARRSAVAEIVSAFRAEAARYAELAAHTSGISSAEGAKNAISTKVLSATLVQDIRAAGAKFDAAIVAATKAEVASMDMTSRSKLVEAAKQDGFLTAGMYWRALAQISELTTSLTNERPDVTLPRTDGDFGQAIERAFSALALQVSGEAERVNLTANDFASAGDETADFLTRLLGNVARDMAEWAGSSGSEGDAMAGLVSSGHAMIAGAWGIIAAGAGAAALAGNAVTRFFGAAGVDWLLDWSKYVVGALMLIGSIRAYIIPMMPFVFVFMSGMAILASLMEAMIALPLWAMKWMKLDNGGDFAGESVRMGLLLTVNIALRPVLAVLALSAAYPVFDATLGTLDRLFATAFLGQTGGHVVGLVGILVMTAMHMYLTWYACMKGFGQIWTLPDRVLAWTGQAGTGGEANLTSGAFGGMLALAGRGNLPKTGLTAALKKGGRK
ncbi:TraY/DotA-like type IV secretion system protein [Agrobacterium albertimagni AOL15]|uniref:TraY/DotA-like type IV secretion system protein n=1 Tax=Agrobacterium albertimagni AOL15 TaxID=1156935 RepID=K2Q6V4_9HYPH|nr:DotA/TraY family protein [Agrobacterium albertimagni]EKF59394.1 TraY/DotA-like type IV secretion system protein [Agrobacterium albertimagni AOL15]